MGQSQQTKHWHWTACWVSLALSSVFGSPAVPRFSFASLKRYLVRLLDLWRAKLRREASEFVLPKVLAREKISNLLGGHADASSSGSELRRALASVMQCTRLAAGPQPVEHKRADGRISFRTGHGPRSSMPAVASPLQRNITGVAWQVAWPAGACLAGRSITVRSHKP